MFKIGLTISIIINSRNHLIKRTIMVGTSHKTTYWSSKEALSTSRWSNTCSSNSFWGVEASKKNWQIGQTLSSSGFCLTTSNSATFGADLVASDCIKSCMDLSILSMVWHPSRCFTKKAWKLSSECLDDDLCLESAILSDSASLKSFGSSLNVSAAHSWTFPKKEKKSSIYDTWMYTISSEFGFNLKTTSCSMVHQTIRGQQIWIFLYSMFKTL